MKIHSEFHCARLHRRLNYPVNFSFQGRVFTLRNWSVGGMFFPMESDLLQLGRAESGEMIIPCSDGIFSLPVHFKAVRETPEGWGCQFLDLPPREQAILHFYAEALQQGNLIRMEELDAAGRVTPPEPAPLPPVLSPAARTERMSADSFVSQKWNSHFYRRIYLIAGLGLVLAILAFVVVPYIGRVVLNKFNRPSEYLKVAESRVEAARLNLRDIEQKKNSIQKLLGSESSGIALHPEQRLALELSLTQLSTEEEMAAVHLRVLEANRDLIQRGDFLIEESIFSGYNTDSRLSQAPYLSDVLQTLVSGRQAGPANAADQSKYELIAQTRLEQAQHALESVRIRHEALQKIVDRAVRAGEASALPQNTVDLMKRDLDLLGVETRRLESLCQLLEQNVHAVQQGNYTFEIQLLQKFDARPLGEIPALDAPATQ